MKSKKKLEILVYRNPLKSEREFHETEYKSISEIYSDLELDRPIGEYFWLDGDTPVFDYDKIPESDKLYIKALFTGEGGDFAEEGGKVAGAGAIGLLVGAGIIAAGILTGGAGWIIAAGVSLAIGGLTAIGSGYYLYTYDIDGTSSYNDSVTRAPSISGASNSNRAGQKVPVLLGRHLVFPWYGARPYSEIPNLDYFDSTATASTFHVPYMTNTETQYLNMLLGNTYTTTDVFDSTIQLGEVPITEYLDTTNGEVLADVISFQEDSLLPDFYPERIIEETLGTEMERGDSEDFVDPIEYTFTTAKNTKTAFFTFIFPSGLYQYIDSTSNSSNVQMTAEWKHVGASDATYTNVMTVGGNPLRIRSSDIKNTCRFGISKEFDNDTSGDSEYNVDRQYTFRFTRVTLDDSDSSLADSDYNATTTFYLENMKSYVGTFDGTNPPETWPIYADTKAKLNTTSLSLKATDQLNGTISNLNYEMIKHMPVWDGLGSGSSNWSYAVTRNPASAFLYTLTDPYVNKDPILTADLADRIDYASLEAWYTFCEDLELECNNYIVSNMTVEELLKNICSTGFASWNVVDNKYTIYIDTYITSDGLPDDGTNALITQLFTPRNSWDFQGSKTLATVPDCLQMTFVNSYIDGTIDEDKLSEGGFTEETRYVFADSRTDQDPTDDDVVENAQVFGAMNPTQVWRLGRYMLACSQLRPEVYTFKADIEHIMCTRWDRIKLQHDVPLFGLSSGRVLTPTESGGNTLGFTSDEIIQYEATFNYAVQVRKADGTITSYPVDNLATDSYTVTLTTPLSGTGIFAEDDLFSFGYVDTETVDLIIEKIEAFDDEVATITCINYDESIYDSYQVGSGSIPAYQSRISKGGSSGAITVNTLPESQADRNNSDNLLNSTASSVDYRTSIVSPTGYAVNTGASFYPDAYTENGVSTIIYTAYWNGDKIYSTPSTKAQTQTQLNNVPSKYPKFYDDGSKILYIHGENNHLYLKNDTTTNELGTAIYTANNVVGFTFYDLTGNIFVWTYTTVYELDASDSYNVLNTYTLAVVDMVIAEDGIPFYIKTDGYIYKNNITFSSESLFYNGSTTAQLQLFGATLYFIRADLGLIYTKALTDTDTSTSDDSDIATSNTWGFAVLNNNSIVYSNTVNGRLYLATPTNAIIKPTLVGESFTLSFTGDITSGSDIITDVDNAYIDQLAVKDTLSAVGLPSGTKIIALGNTEITISVTATATNTNATIVAGGDRILLDANKVIIDGTIEANLLAASAIDSKARASNGEKITEIDLDSGTQKFRNSAGDIIFDFDPNRVGSELAIDGTITVSEIALISEDVENGIITTQKISTGDVTLESSNYVTGVSGWKIDSDTDSAEFLDISARGTMSSTTYTPGSAGWQINADGNAEFNSGTFRGTLVIGSSGTSVADVETTADSAQTDATQALSDAADAQSTADGKIVSFYQTSAPTASAVGDIWIETDNDNKPWRWSGSAWVSIQDGTIATAQATADGKNTIYYQTTAPTGANAGDIWYDTDDGNLQYIYNGSAWEVKISLQSSNYSSGTAGWAIDEAGNAEFNNVTVRGTVYADAGEFINVAVSGNLTASGITMNVESLDLVDTITGDSTVSGCALTPYVIIRDSGASGLSVYYDFQGSYTSSFVVSSIIDGTFISSAQKVFCAITANKFMVLDYNTDYLSLVELSLTSPFMTRVASGAVGPAYGLPTSSMCYIGEYGGYEYLCVGSPAAVASGDRRFAIYKSNQSTGAITAVTTFAMTLASATNGGVCTTKFVSNTTDDAEVCLFFNGGVRRLEFNLATETGTVDITGYTIGYDVSSKTIFTSDNQTLLWSPGGTNVCASSLIMDSTNNYKIGSYYMSYLGATASVDEIMPIGSSRLMVRDGTTIYVYNVNRSTAQAVSYQRTDYWNDDLYMN